MRRPTTFILTALAIFLAVGGVAQAATPFTAGSGGDPDVAVDENGVGHVVWMQPGSNATVGYCRVPAGESACDRTHSLSFQGTTSAQPAGRALVFAPAPNKVVVVSACTQCPSGAILEGTNRWVSTDGGATFSASVKIGEDFESGGAGTWLEDADMFVAVTGRLVKATKLLPGPVLYPSGAGLPFITDPSTVYTPQVVRLRDTNTLVAASNDLGRIRYAVYTGGSLNPDAINSASPVNWDRDLTLPGAEPSAKESALNSGPRGVYLTYLSGPIGDKQIGLRRFNESSNRFGSPVYVQGGDGIETQSLDLPDSYQDASGRIHVVWRSLYDGGRLRYRVSDTSGSNFGPVGTLAKGETILEPEVAAGPSGTGFAVWRTTAAAVRVVPLEPEPESASDGPGGPGGPGGSDGPGGPLPRIGGARIGDTTLRPGQGTTFTFTSSKAGRAVLTIEKQFKGLKVKRRVKTKTGKRKVRRVCVPQTKKRLRALRRKARNARAYRKALRRQTCRGFRKVGVIRQRVQVGRNTIRFNGRVAGRKLGRGVYRAKLVVIDSAGQVSRAERLRFKVVGKPKPKPKRARGKRR